MKRRRYLWIPIVIGILAVIAAVIAVLVWHNRSSKSVDAFPVSTVCDTYWGDTATLEATVTSGKVQNVALQEGLVDKINVQVGDTVQKGDVLMVYDTTSFQLTLQADEASIAVLESNLEKSQSNLALYKTLKPSESAPAPTITIVHHTAEPVDTMAKVSAGASASESGDIYYCTPDTVVSADFLRALVDSDRTVQLQMYENNVLIGTWTVSGSDLPVTTKTETVEVPDEQETPDSGDTGADTGDTGAETATQAVTTQTVTTVDTSAIQDWTLGEGITVNEDGTADVDFSKVHYGTLETVVPEQAEWDEEVYTENYTIDSKGNYLYSKTELAQMITDTEKEIADEELSLKEAQLKYQQDQLVGEDGEVKASIDGTVTELNSTAEVSVGETLLTIKGDENYTITAYVDEMRLADLQIGDMMSVTCYESGNYVTATISDISDTPMEGSYNYGDANPNNSYYPVTATVDDPEAELSLGEWCEATLESGEDGDGSWYLQMMYVRKDDGGSYVMKADENGKLTKQYVNIGKTLWGSEVEIRGGLSQEDYIAFPYGTNVREGVTANLVESPYEDVYY